jgi:hypothetical protein
MQISDLKAQTLLAKNVYTSICNLQSQIIKRQALLKVGIVVFGKA